MPNIKKIIDRLFPIDADSIITWRKQMVQTTLLVIALLGLPNLIFLITAGAIPDPVQRPAAIIFTLIYTVLVVMIFLRNMDYRIRSGTLYGFIYLSALLAFMRGGLAGIGRDYLLVLPLLAMILSGTITGIILAAAGIATILLMGLAANYGLLTPFLIYSSNPTNLSAWLLESTYLITVLVFIFLLLLSFHRFQINTLEQSHQAQEDLAVLSGELRSINANLEGTVADRTARLSAALLETDKAKSLAEAANKAKTSFYANLSHEIRTPLNGLIGVVDLLGSTSLDSRQHEYVEIMRSSSETLLTIINDLLDISKIEAGGVNLEKIPFDLVQCIESSGGSLGAEIQFS